MDQEAAHGGFLRTTNKKSFTTEVTELKKLKNVFVFQNKFLTPRTLCTLWFDLEVLMQLLRNYSAPKTQVGGKTGVRMKDANSLYPVFALEKTRPSQGL